MKTHDEIYRPYPYISAYPGSTPSEVARDFEKDGYVIMQLSIGRHILMHKDNAAWVMIWKDQNNDGCTISTEWRE
jgi:hypothetical protein